MNSRFIFILSFLCILTKAMVAQQTKNANPNWCDSIIDKIATDIELLKTDFPQLKNFSKEDVIKPNSCKLNYEFDCYFPENRPGWAGGVPNPNPKGIWFYISIWDENDPIESMAQINTQPMMPNWYIKDKRVTFLILEGKKTKILYDRFIGIMEKYGLYVKQH